MPGRVNIVQHAAKQDPTPWLVFDDSQVQGQSHESGVIGFISYIPATNQGGPLDDSPILKKSFWGPHLSLTSQSHRLPHLMSRTEP